MTYGDREKALMIGLYEGSNKSPTVAANLIKEKSGLIISPPTIAAVWRKENLEIGPKGNQKRFSDEDFRRIHEESQGVLETIMERTGYKRGRILGRCVELDLTYKRAPNNANEDRHGNGMNLDSKVSDLSDVEVKESRRRLARGFYR